MASTDIPELSPCLLSVCMRTTTLVALIGECSKPLLIASNREVVVRRAESEMASAAGVTRVLREVGEVVLLCVRCVVGFGCAM